MAKFNRKLKRQRNNYQFTKKTEETSVIKNLLTFSWIPRKFSSLLYLIIAFLISTIVIIPVLIVLWGLEFGMLFGHGVVTSLCIVTIFYLLQRKDEKVDQKELGLRFLSMAIFLSIFAIIALLVL